MYTVYLDGREVAGEQHAEDAAVMATDQVEQYGNTQVAEVKNPEGEVVYRLEVSDMIYTTIDKIWGQA